MRSPTTEGRPVKPPPPTVPDVVRAPAAGRPARGIDQRLRHGLLRFPFGEPAETRGPRW